MSELLEKLVREVVGLRRRVGALETLEAPLPRMNLLTNGGFEIWQRGDGPFTVSSAYTADRWQILLGTASTISISKDTTHADAGSTACAAVTYTHSAASSLRQTIEDYVQLRGRAVSLSVRVRASTANAVRLAVIDSTGTTYSDYHSGSGQYETLTVTRTIATAATSVQVAVELSATSAAYIDNAMLVVGDSPAPYVPLHPAEEWERCQRYYEVHGGAYASLGIWGFRSEANSKWEVYQQFAVRKSVTPIVTKVGTWEVYNAGQPTADRPSVSGYRLKILSLAAGVMFAHVNSPNDVVTAEANP